MKCDDVINDRIWLFPFFFFFCFCSCHFDAAVLVFFCLPHLRNTKMINWMSIRLYWKNREWKQEEKKKLFSPEMNGKRGRRVIGWIKFRCIECSAHRNIMMTTTTTTSTLTLIFFCVASVARNNPLGSAMNVHSIASFCMCFSLSWVSSQIGLFRWIYITQCASHACTYCNDSTKCLGSLSLGTTYL